MYQNLPTIYPYMKFKHYGGDPFTPERLLEEISKVHYSGINWKKLKIQKGINRE